MFLKLQENDLETHLSKDLPQPLQISMEKRLSDTQDKMDKIYGGTVIDPPVENNTQLKTEPQKTPSIQSTQVPKVGPKPEEITQPVELSVEPLSTIKQKNR